MSEPRPDGPQIPRLAPGDQVYPPGPLGDIEDVDPHDDGRVAQLAGEAGEAGEDGAAPPTETAVLPRLPELPHTGDQVVDEALQRLVAVQDQPPAEQVETYVGAHRALQDRLADLEE